ncbi:glycosyltransferase [Candidatus Bathyarchaeota archaeon]|nr:glycosyltransferase [Candidatus Bathyarchaeota archaeon]
MNICLVTDPLVTTMGAVRPAILLAREFVQNGNKVILLTPKVDKGIEHMLQKDGIDVEVVSSKFSFLREFPTFDAWAKSLIKVEDVLDRLERKMDIIINTSSCIALKSHAFYGQGPMTDILRDIFQLIPLKYKIAYSLSAPFLRKMEERSIRRLRRLTKFFIANSSFCASLYRRLGINIDHIIYPPLDCSFFKPSSPKPSQDYVLTHFGIYGKEGRFSVIKAVADSGVYLKVFGKTKYVPKSLLRHPNINFLGNVSDEELVNLYSNALFTLFAFSHEPFGYIPVESMACGTPVLTYNRQGPSETVLDNETGWLAENDVEIVSLAVNLWKHGYEESMRRRCRERALDFDVKKIYMEWLKILDY